MKFPYSRFGISFSIVFNLNYIKLLVTYFNTLQYEYTKYTENKRLGKFY